MQLKGSWRTLVCFYINYVCYQVNRWSIQRIYSYGTLLKSKVQFTQNAPGPTESFAPTFFLCCPCITSPYLLCGFVVCMCLREPEIKMHLFVSDYTPDSVFEWRWAHLRGWTLSINNCEIAVLISAVHADSQSSALLGQQAWASLHVLHHCNWSVPSRSQLAAGL